MSVSRQDRATVRALNLLVAVAMGLVGSSLVVAAASHNASLALGAGTALVGSAIAYASTRALARVGTTADEKARKQVALQRQLDLFANVVDQLSWAVVVSGDDGAIFANRRARELGGWSAAPSGDGVSQLQPPWDLRDAEGRHVDRDAWPLRRALLRGEQTAAEALQLIRPDGSASWFETSAGPVYGAGMEPLGAMMTLLDVTERNRLERRQTLLARTSALVTSADHERKLSQSVARLFVPELADWCTVDVLDESGEDVVRAGAAHCDPAQERSLMTTAPEGRWEKDRSLGLDPDRPGRGLAVKSAPASLAVPLPGRRGVVGVLTLGMSDSGRRLDGDQLRLAQDVARHAALAIENATLFRQTRDASRAKDEFLAILGHELRNPLAPISTALSLMETKGHAGLEKEYMVLRRQVSHMRRLVDDLLDVTRIARGTMELRFETLDLADAVAEGVEIVSPLLEKKTLRLHIDVAPGQFLLRGDRTRLAQVVANLLGNAAKWSSAGQTVAIRARSDRGGAALSIRDHGAGISADLLPRVFDLFAQAAQPRDRASGGLGVGLALVKTIVGLHQGLVTAASEGMGLGSELTVWLPLTPVEASAQPGGDVAPAAKDTKGRRVLIVDDNVDAAVSLGEMLSREGFDVRVVHDGPSALGIVDAWRPEVALLDIGLPVMDGYELAERLKERLPDVRLIAVSGYAQPADRTTSRLGGFESHLAKPVDWEVMKAAIHSQGRTRDRRPAARPSRG